MRPIVIALAVTLVAARADCTFAQQQSDAQAAATHQAAEPAPNAQPAADVPIATRQFAFSIPFQVSPSDTPPSEVQLHVSSDRGKNWTLYARQQPTATAFSFRAMREGEYWFAARTIDQHQRASPATQLQAELKVLIDATPPKLEFDATIGPAGEVVARWHVADESLLSNSLKIEYQPVAFRLTSRAHWQQVAIDPPRDSALQTDMRGQSSWWPGTTAKILRIRASVRDRAGNFAEVNRQLTASGQRAAAPPEMLDSPHIDLSQLEKINTHHRTDEFGESIQSGDPNGSDRAGQLFANPDSAIPHFDGPSSSVADDVIDSATERNIVPHTERLRVTNFRRIRLQYDVESVGPSGVAKVELWGTRDGGQTWESWGTDPDNQSPFLISFEEEGVYGFRVAITSGLGLASPSPRPGELADIWIEVDLTNPTAKIVSAPFGTGREVGNLIIQWTADDRRLAPRPITLLFSAYPQGPWTMLADGLPNSGQYHWRIEQGVPREVYLRLEVRDAAGNVGIDQLTRPVNLEGLNPKGRIRDFQAQMEPLP